MSLAPVIAVVGPSGVGKDSVMQALADRDCGFRLARRVITRDPEAGGEVYDPVSVPVFQKMQAEGAFVLNWQAHGLHYGIPHSIQELRKGARAVLVNLSRSVLLEAQETLAPFHVLSLTADPALLARRLADRGRETKQDREKRLSRAIALPDGLTHVIEIDNGGRLDQTVTAILAQFQPESV